VNRQFESKAAADNLFLGERSQRGDDSKAEIKGRTGGDGEFAEEFGRRVRKRIVVERADGDGANFMERAENGSFGKKQQIPAGEIDSFVASFRARHPPASRAPMRTVEIIRGQTEDGQRFMANAGYREIAAE